MLAFFLLTVKRLSQAQEERYGPMVDDKYKVRVQKRLYDIIDRNRDGKMTAEELQAAIRLPAHAQSISQLIIHGESEWYYRAPTWDALDELLGHSGSTPNLNWLAEKERFKQISWWDDVAEKVGIPTYGKVYHFHPLGLVSNFFKKIELINVNCFLQQYEQAHALFSPGTTGLSQKSKENLKELIISINAYYESAPQTANIYEVSYMLATARHETYHFPTGEFFSELPEVGSFSYFNKYDPILAATPELRERARGNGNTVEGDGFKYRGRGCVHLTWKKHYQTFTDLLSIDFVSNPDRAAKFEHSVPIMIQG
ncbi:hypothetical protein QNM99_09985 [Pseudomonas sp. PCH446]